MKKKVYILPPTRTEQFVKEYFANGFNGTKAALKVFCCSSRESAKAMGSYYLKKAKPLIRMIFDDSGLTLGTFIEIAGDKLEETGDIAWFDRLYQLGGYE